MSRIVCSFLFLSFCILLSQACHSAEDEDRRRKKRQAGNNAIEIGNTGILREYFVNCLRSRVGEIWEWESVIDTTVLDTNWYEDNTLSDCSVSNNDTVACWSARLNALLTSSSFLMEPTRQCISQYSTDTERGVAGQSAAIFQPLSENTNSAPPVRCVEPMRQPFRPNAPQTRQYSSCGTENFIQPDPRRRRLDFPSVIQFVAQHTICSSELSGCDNGNDVIATRLDPNVPSWPYRLEALTKSSSPLRNVIELCNIMIFPVSTEWSMWGECSASCGGGTQSRTRECSEQGCSTMESRMCLETQCPECQISRFARRRCSRMAIMSRDQCLQQNCCYDRGMCYRSRSSGRSRMFDRETRTTSQCSSRSMGLNFRPTQPSIRSSGGQSGYPGSSIQLNCDENAGMIPCVNRRTSCNSCARMACCWSERRQICYRPQITVPTIRTVCPPGFENPPACTDINDCTEESCLNGGICVDRIQGFECRCVAPFTGTRCEIAPAICASPPVINFATPSSSGPFNTGESVTYLCDSGYRLSGSATLTCLENGFFSPAAPTCNRLCTSPPPTSSGVLFSPVLSEYDDIDIVTYYCSNGILSYSPATNHCKSGMWIFNSPSCFSCSQPLPISIGFFRPVRELYNVNDIVNYFCPPGYILVGQSTVTCLTSGNWNQTFAPMCSNNVCPVLSNIANASVNPQSVLESPSPIGTIAQFTCDQGFFPSSISLRIECQALVSGPRWISDSSQPSCLRGCLPPSLNPGVISNSSKTIYEPGEQIDLSCRSGFTLIGPAIITCLSTQDFTFPGSQTTSCAANCGSPPNPPQNATFVGTDMDADASGTFPLETSATYQCQNRTIASGMSTIACLEAGWQILSLTCTIVCILTDAPNPDPSSILQVVLIPPPYFVGSIISYTCVSPLQTIMNGPDRVFCQGNGMWLPTNVGQCEFAFCLTPPTPPSGANSNPPTTSSFVIGQSITYSCNNSAFAIENNVARCQPDATWIPSVIANCVQFACQAPTSNSIANGGILIDQTHYSVSSALSYTCNSGFGTRDDTVTRCNRVADDFVWTLDSNPPSCLRNCPAPDSVAYAVLNASFTIWLSGDAILYVCNDSLQISGNNENQCIDSQWILSAVRGNLPTCICSSPPTPPENATIKPLRNSSFEIGQKIKYKCNDDAFVIANDISTCQPNGLWMPSVIGPCTQIACQSPSPINNGSITTNQDLYFIGSKLTYSCNSGFGTRDYVITECDNIEGNFTWSLESNLPRCLKICASPPLAPPLASTSPSLSFSFLVGDSIVYTCLNQRFTIENNTSVCQEDRQWIPDSIAMCRQQDCGQPIVITIGNGSINASSPNYSIGTSLTYSCNSGFATTDPVVTTCSGLFAWNLDSSPPNCSRVCLNPPQPPRGAISTPQLSPEINFFVGDEIVYNCTNELFTLSNNIALCLPNGSWSLQTMENCRQYRCGPPRTDGFGNGSISSSASLLIPGSVLDYICNSGFATTDNTSTFCSTTNFTWSLDNNLPRCRKICNTPPNTPMGSTPTPDPSVTTFLETDSIRFICDNPLERIPNNTAICQSNGNFFPNSIGSCMIALCSTPPIPPSGANSNPPTTSSFVIGQSITYSCNNSAFAIENNVARCQPDATWIPSVIANCVQFACQAPTSNSIANGGILIDQTHYSVSSALSYTCNSGFETRDDTVTRCNRVADDFVWTLDSNPPSCLRNCPAPDSVAYAVLNASFTIWLSGDAILYVCNDSLQISGNNENQCIDSQWILSAVRGNLPTCICSSPPTPPENATIKPLRNSSFEIGQKIKYECNDDAFIIANDISTCQPNGLWMPSVIGPCTQIACQPPSRISNGSITVNQNLYFIGSKLTYSCNSGFGTRDEVITECQNVQGNFTWSQENNLPRCLKICLSPPLAPPSTFASPPINSTFLVGESIVYNCINQAFGIDNNTSMCQEDRQWIPDSIGMCRQQDCERPSVITISNGNINASLPNYSIGTSLTYTCNSGFATTDPVVTTCSGSFAWNLDSSPPNCSRVCLNPPQPPRGAISTPQLSPEINFFVGDEIVYNCTNELFTLSNNIALCLPNGSWSLQTMENCRQYRCGPPRTDGFGNGSISSSASLLIPGSVLDYICNSGFGTTDNTSTFCSTTNFTWSLDNNLPRCRRICNTPPNTSMGSTPTPDPSVTTFLETDSIRFICDNPLERIPNNTAVCRSDGSFFPNSIGSCMVALCGPPNSNIANGSIAISNQTYQINAQLKYVCNSGYETRNETTTSCLSDTFTWSLDDMIPTCLRVCSQPPATPENATPYPSPASATFLEGDTIAFSCNSVVEDIVDNVAVCQATGLFVPSAISPCAVSRCNEPNSTIANGIINISQTAYEVNSRLTYSCNSGFGTRSPTVTVCQNSTFIWSLDTRVPQCLQQCSNPENVTDATQNPIFSPWLVGDAFSYTCRDNLRLNGSGMNQCIQSGSLTTWRLSMANFNLPTCVCSSPPLVPENATATPSTTSIFAIGAAVNYSCNDPAFTIVNNIATCQMNGSWIPNKIEKCVQQTCRPPTSMVGNGSISITETTYSVGTQLTYSCNSGFSIRDTSLVTNCRSNFTWSLDSNTPSCLAICPTPPSIANATPNQTFNPWLVGDTFMYQCNDQLVLLGNGFSQCFESGGLTSWSLTPQQSNLPTCVCSTPPRVPANAVATPPVTSTFSIGQSISYSCNQSSFFLTTNASMCQNNGLWIPDTIGSCERFACDPPSSIVGNSSISITETTYSVGIQLTYSCNSGFSIRDTSLVTNCRSNFTWSLDSNTPSCLAICPTPPSVANATLNQTFNPWLVGDIFMYQCNDQLVLLGNGFSQCFESGGLISWSLTPQQSNLPTCVCSTPPAVPPNAGANPPINQTYLVGESITYFCDNPAFTIYSNVSTCQSNGLWLPSTIQMCTQIECEPPQSTISNGSISITQMTYSVGSTLSYRCNVGYGTRAANLTTVCRNNFTWSLDNNVPSCLRICNTPPTTPQSSMSDPDPATFVFLAGDRISFFCNNPRETIASNISTCENDGQFVPSSLGSCMVTRCGQPNSIIANGSIPITQQAYDPNAQLNYSCNSGYGTRNQTTTTCLEVSLVWDLDNSIPLCIRECPTPDPVANSQQSPLFNPYLAGDSFTYVCNGALVRSTIDAINTCSDSLTGSSWSLTNSNVDFPQCFCNTSSFPQITTGNAVTVIFDQNVLPLTNVRYACQSGYVVVGRRNNRCNTEGIWVNPAPRCELACDGNAIPSPLNSTITSDSDTAPYFVGETVSFVCNNHFSSINDNLLFNTCVDRGGRAEWESSDATLMRLCRPDVNFVIVLDPSFISSVCAGISPGTAVNVSYSAEQIAFPNMFYSAWGSDIIAFTSSSTANGSRLAVITSFRNQEDMLVCNPLADFNATLTQRQSAINDAFTPCITFSPGLIVDCGRTNYVAVGAPRSYGLNPNIPVVYLLLVDGNLEENDIRFADFSFNTLPRFTNFIFSLSLIQSPTSNTTNYLISVAQTRSTTPGLYLGTTSQFTSVIDSLHDHIVSNPIETP